MPQTGSRCIPNCALWTPGSMIQSLEPHPIGFVWCRPDASAGSRTFFYHDGGVLRAAALRSGDSSVRAGCYNAGMTLVEVTYQLQAPLHEEQLIALGQFANLYGLRRFRVDRERNQISVEYDGSRLKESEVAQALRRANIAVAVRV